MCKIVGIIPARGGSKRLPAKNVLLLLGKPLIAYTIEAALDSKLLDSVYVSSDDKAIFQVAEKFGAIPILRPAELAADNSPIDDALRHAVEFIGGIKEYPDIVVHMQANMPVRQPDIIDTAIKHLQETNAETVATAAEVWQHPEWLWKLRNGKAVPYMDRSSCRSQDLEQLYLLDGAVNCVKTETLMKTADNRKAYSYMGQDIRIIVQEAMYNIEIDTMEDFRLVELIMRGIVASKQD